MAGFLEGPLVVDAKVKPGRTGSPYSRVSLSLKATVGGWGADSRGYKCTPLEADVSGLIIEIK